MRGHTLTFIVLFIFALTFGQESTEMPLDKPSEGKSMVYFVRSGGGTLINFRVYDYDKPIGRLKFGDYIKYETEPGEHVFWGSAENRDFLKANLDENKIYVVHMIGEMGMAFVRLEVEGLDPEDFRDQKLLHKVMSNHNKVDAEELKDDQEKLQWEVEIGLEKYEKRNKPGYKSIKVIEAHQHFEHANKPIKKKKQKKK